MLKCFGRIGIVQIILIMGILRKVCKLIEVFKKLIGALEVQKLGDKPLKT